MKRPVPPPEFALWHDAHCPALQEGREPCDGVSVWWMNGGTMTCLEKWEETKP